MHWLLQEEPQVFLEQTLANLINEAALFAARYGDKKVDQNHLDLAKDKIMMGPERNQ